MESSNKEEEKICLMENHQGNEVTFHLSYQDLFCICKKLTKKMSKLEQIFSTSKDTISFLESKNKNLLKEIKNLRERQNDIVQNFSPSNEELYELVKCDKCDILTNEIVILKKTFGKFTKGREYLNVLLGNQRVFYNKVGLGMNPRTIARTLVIFIVLNLHLSVKP